MQPNEGHSASVCAYLRRHPLRLAIAGFAVLAIPLGAVVIPGIGGATDPLGCPGGNTANGDIYYRPDAKGHATSEAAAQAGAVEILGTPPGVDVASSGEPNVFEIANDGQTVGILETEELPNGNWVVGHAEACQFPEAPIDTSLPPSDVDIPPTIP